MCACVRAYVRACVRASVRAYVRARVPLGKTKYSKEGDWVTKVGNHCVRRLDHTSTVLSCIPLVVLEIFSIGVCLGQASMSPAALSNLWKEEKEKSKTLHEHFTQLVDKVLLWALHEMLGPCATQVRRRIC